MVPKNIDGCDFLLLIFYFLFCYYEFLMPTSSNHLLRVLQMIFLLAILICYTSPSNLVDRRLSIFSDSQIITEKVFLLIILLTVRYRYKRLHTSVNIVSKIEIILH